MVQTDLVTATVADGIAEIRLSHPEKRNCFSVGLTEQFHAAIREALLDDVVRAILLTADGPVFSAGIDLELLSGERPDDRERFVELETEFFEWMRNASTPIIAAATGHAIGTAATLFLYGADLKVVAPDVEFWWPEVEYGIAPVVRTVYLVNEAGSALALEAMLLGEHIPADRAETAGLVNRVVAAPDVEDTARDMAERIVGLDREFDVAGAFLDAVQHAQREMGAASMAYADWQQHGLEANR